MLNIHAIPSGEICAKLLLDEEADFWSSYQFTSDGTRLLAGMGSIIYIVNLLPTVVSKDWIQEGIRVTENARRLYFRQKAELSRVIEKEKGYSDCNKLLLNKNTLVFAQDHGLSFLKLDFSSFTSNANSFERETINALCEDVNNEFFDLVLADGEVVRCVLEDTSVKELTRFSSPVRYFGDFLDFYDQRRGLGFKINMESGRVTQVYNQAANPPLTSIDASNLVMDWNGRKLGLGTALNRKQFIIGDAETGEIIRGYPWECEFKSASSVQDQAIELDGEYYGIDANPDIVSYRVRSPITSDVPGYVIAMSMDETKLLLFDATDGKQIRMLPIPDGLKSLQQVYYFDVSVDGATIVMHDQAQNTYVFSISSDAWKISGGQDSPSLDQDTFRKRLPSSDCRVAVEVQDALLLVQPNSQDAVVGWTDLSRPDPAWIGELSVNTSPLSLGERIAKEKNEFATFYRFQQSSTSMMPSPLRSFAHNEQGSLDYRERLSQLIEQNQWSLLDAEFEPFVEHTLKTYADNPNHAGIVLGEHALRFNSYPLLFEELGDKAARFAELALTHRQQLPSTERDQLAAIRAFRSGIDNWETEKSIWNDYLNVRNGRFSFGHSSRFGDTLPRHWKVLVDFYRSQFDAMANQPDDWAPVIKLATLLRDASKSDDLKALTPRLQAIAFPWVLDSDSVDSLRLSIVAGETFFDLGKMEEAIGILSGVAVSAGFANLSDFERFDVWRMLFVSAFKAGVPTAIIDQRFEKMISHFDLVARDKLIIASEELIDVATLLVDINEAPRARRLLNSAINRCLVDKGVYYDRDVVLLSAWIEIIGLMRKENDATPAIVLARILGFVLEIKSKPLFGLSKLESDRLKKRFTQVVTGLQPDDYLPLTSRSLAVGNENWDITYAEFEEMERYLGSNINPQSENFQICKQAFALWKSSPSLDSSPTRYEYQSYFLDTRSCLHESLGLNSWLLGVNRHMGESSKLWSEDEGGTRKPFQRQLPAEWPENANGLFLSHARASEESVGWDKPRYDFSADDRAFLLQGIPTLPSIFAHAPSKHLYQLDQKWHRFTGKVGIDRSLSNSSCVFEVLGDGKSLWKSARISGWDAEEFDIDVSTVSTLELVVNDAGDGNNNDWGCWFLPLLTRNQAVGMRIVYPPAAADRLNWAVWYVVQPTPNGRYSRSRYEQELTAIRKLVAQYPNGGAYNTLGVAEFRCGNYQAAIDACQKSIELQPKESGLEVPFPVDYAVVAMSYLHLGQLDKVDEYRIKMEQAMNSLTFLNNAECESFQAELKAALEAHRQTR